MVKGFLRILASTGAVLVIVTTTTLAHRGRASTTTAGDGTDADGCQTESSACSLDATCSSCNLIAFASSSEYEECIDVDVSATGGGGGSSAECDGFMAGPCCVDEVSDLECLESEIFLDFTLCTIASLGCSADEITCRDSSDANDDVEAGAASPINGATASSLGRTSTAAAVVVSVGCAFFMFSLPPLLPLV